MTNRFVPVCSPSPRLLPRMAAANLAWPGDLVLQSQGLHPLQEHQSHPSPKHRPWVPPSPALLGDINGPVHPLGRIPSQPGDGCLQPQHCLPRRGKAAEQVLGNWGQFPSIMTGSCIFLPPHPPPASPSPPALYLPGTAAGGGPRSPMPPPRLCGSCRGGSAAAARQRLHVCRSCKELLPPPKRGQERRVAPAA